MDLVAAHCAHLTRLNRRPGTINQRRWALQRLARHLSPTALIDATLEDLRRHLERGEHSVEYRASETNHICGFYNWLVWDGLRLDNPTVRLERPSRPQHLPRPMRPEWVTIGLTEAPQPIRTWLWLGAYAGLRACEVGPLRGEDIRRDVIVIREQKGGDMATVPISPALRPVLSGLAREGWLFPHRGHGAAGPTSAGQVSRHANHWLHDHGIPETFHQTRHWFGSTIYQLTRDIRLTQELLRHKSTQATDGYTKLDPGDAARAVSLLPDFGP